MELPKKSGLLQVKNKRVTLAHEFLTAAVFKSAAEGFNTFFYQFFKCVIVMYSSNFETFRWLSFEFYYKYNYDLSKLLRDIGKICAYRLASIYTKQEMAHTLMSIELVKDKYIQYLQHEPKDIHFNQVF